MIYIILKVFKKIEIKINQKVISIQNELSMFQPTDFLDGENIVVINNVPYFRYTGGTYKDKLKNGLSLDYVFYQQDMVPIVPKEAVKEIDSSESRESLEEYIDYEENYEFYEQKKFQITDMTRKGKWSPFKKRQARNMKKTMVKTNGYEDKLFVNERELPELFDESQIEIDYDDTSYISYDNDDEYNDNLSFC